MSYRLLQPIFVGRTDIGGTAQESYQILTRGFSGAAAKERGCGFDCTNLLRDGGSNPLIQ